jgi:beta-glucosidase
VFVFAGYEVGIHAPGIRDWSTAMRASHVVNLAQAEAIRAARAAGARVVGSALDTPPVQPASSSAEDLAASERAHAQRNEWFLRPAMLGAYPQAFENQDAVLEMMDVRPGDLEAIHEPFDVLGINVYTRYIAAHDDAGGPLRVALTSGPGEKTTYGWEIYPPAIYESLMRASKDYPGLPLWVTENGSSFEDRPDASGFVDDRERLAYLRGYIGEVARAVADGADVRGYFVWSLLDNFEWSEGYRQRFGVIRIGDDLSRTVKASGRWYAEQIKAQAAPSSAA